MSIEVVRAYVERVWNQHDLSALDDLTSAGYRRHLGPGTEPLDRSHQRARIAGLQSAFPDISFTIEDLLTSGDRVTLRATVRGTNRGEFQGRPATGRAVEFQAIDVFRVTDGLIVEHWGLLDMPALTSQLSS